MAKKSNGKRRRRGSLVYQVTDNLCSRRLFGVPKKSLSEEMQREKITGIKTFKSYLQQCVKFVKWTQAQGYTGKTLGDVRQYVPIYLEAYIAGGYSASTVHSIAAALAKLYRCSLTDFGVDMPPRVRSQVKRSRDPDVTTTRGYEDLRLFCESTGLRRHEVKAFCPADIYPIDSSQTWPRGVTHYVQVWQGKGGRPRKAPIVKSAEMDALIEKMQRESELKTTFAEPWWGSIPKKIDIHAMRRTYAKTIYCISERTDPSRLRKSERYHCRGEMRGVIYDRLALRMVSEALGHSRVDVAANAYLL